MKKLAVFVEGQTEQLFVEKLLEEAAGRNRISIEKRQAFGGQSTKRRLKIIQASDQNSNHKYFAQIIDCGADNRVKSDVVDNYDGLVAKGFDTILAIRDVYPDVTYNDIASLRAGLRYRVKTKPLGVIFVLGIMEIETWFISEHTHFQRIHPSITPDLIITKLGFDPRAEDIQLRPHPADDLDKIYRLAGFSYTKNRNVVQRTVNVLDYERLYLELPARLLDLHVLVHAIDQFLSI